jgi:hypothetical protein
VRPSLRALFPLVALLVWAVAPASAQRLSLNDVLSRLGVYLQEYEQTLATVVAEERYVQELAVNRWPRNEDGTIVIAPGASVPPTERTTRVLLSEYALARAPGGQTWTGFRDTFEVDGKPVRDRDARLLGLLAEGSAESSAQAMRITRENARFNLGTEFVLRTINVPPLVLDLIHPRNRSRLRFSQRGEDTVEGTRVWIVGYEERTRPTLIRTPQGRDQVAKGTVAVDPASGRILRTALTWENGPAGSIEVEYRHDEHVGALVPATMVEQYRRSGAATITGRATYTNYRRFQTSGRLVR